MQAVKASVAAAMAKMPYVCEGPLRLRNFAADRPLDEAVLWGVWLLMAVWRRARKSCWDYTQTGRVANKVPPEMMQACP